MYTFIETWMTGTITSLTSSATVVVTAGLGLCALIVGAFFLIGLGKKAVKSSK